MPSPFDISVATNTVKLDNKREGVATFTVKNNTRRRLHATAKLATQPPDGAQWLTILPPEGGSTDSANVRDFPIDGTQQFQVRIAVPMDAAPASYTLTLTLADEVNPDDNFTVSPEVMFTVVEAPKPEPRPFPTWIIPAAIIAVILIVVIIVAAVVSSNNQANANATGTAVALDDARATADAGTATAVAAMTGTQQAINATATAAAASAAATQTALNVFLGNWVPVDTSTTGVILAMGIDNAGNNRVDITYKSNCPPQGNVCNVTASTYTISNVPFNPLQLAAGIQNTTILIQPANNNQIVVTVQSGITSSSQTMRHKTRFEQFELGSAVLELPSTISQSQINHLLILSTPSP